MKCKIRYTIGGYWVQTSKYFMVFNDNLVSINSIHLSDKQEDWQDFKASQLTERLREIFSAKVLPDAEIVDEAIDQFLKILPII